jgi:hypothetical protein
VGISPRIIALASSAAARALALKVGFWEQMGQSLSVPISSVVSGFTAIIISSYVITISYLGENGKSPFLFHSFLELHLPPNLPEKTLAKTLE